MTVHFIGAGPGAADLITLRGRDLIAAAPVVLYAGSLVPEEVIAFAAADAKVMAQMEKKSLLLLVVISRFTSKIAAK